jgi:activator of HSP90 ATPase
MAISQEITFETTPEKLYGALTQGSEFAAATGAPAEISPDEGGRFSCFGGQITGRHIELQPNKRIIQAWRAGPWADGVYSIVSFDISQSGDATILHMRHAGFPDGEAEHLDGGWKKMYWDQLQAYLA